MTGRDFRSWRAFRNLCADGLYQLSCWVKASDVPHQPMVLPIRLRVVERNTERGERVMAAMTLYGGDTLNVHDDESAAGGPTKIILKRLPDEAGVPALDLTLWTEGSSVVAEG